MLPIIDLVVMALFFAGLIAYVVLAGRRKDNGGQRMSTSRTVGSRELDRGDIAPVDDRSQAREPKRAPARLAPLAAGISLLAPGLGHFLIGARMRGFLWLGGWLILALASGALHSPIVFIWMVLAAVDAYLIGRSSDGSAGAVSPDQLRPHP